MPGGLHCGMDIVQQEWKVPVSVGFCKTKEAYAKKMTYLEAVGKVRRAMFAEL